jgi:hypothetical protein
MPWGKRQASVLSVSPDTYHNSSSFKFRLVRNPKKELEVLPVGLFITTVLVMLTYFVDEF